MQKGRQAFCIRVNTIVYTAGFLRPAVYNTVHGQNGCGLYSLLFTYVMGIIKKEIEKLDKTV